MLEESGILRRQDRLSQVLRDVVVVNDDAPLDGELAHELAVLAEDARNGIRRVTVERADFGQIIGIGKQDAAHGAKQCRGDKQSGNAGVAGVSDGDFHGRC